MVRFKPDSDEIFVQVPQPDGGGQPSRDRILHRARVAGGDGHELILELEQPLPLEVQQNVFVYYEQQRKFMQQPACVLELQSETSVRLETTADAILAESRQSYRCGTLVEDIQARLGSEQGCEVLDVSQTGLAVLARTTYAPGSKLDVSLTFEGEPSNGLVVVQSVQVPPGGRTRYGLRVIEGDLVQALPRIAMAVQRNQLRRRAGN